MSFGEKMNQKMNQLYQQLEKWFHDRQNSEKYIPYQMMTYTDNHDEWNSSQWTRKVLTWKKAYEIYMGEDEENISNQRLSEMSNRVLN